MKTRYTVAVSMIAGAALGGAAIQGLHAQAKPPVYYVAEIEVTNATLTPRSTRRRRKRSSRQPAVRSSPSAGPPPPEEQR